mgnify:FL=1
MGLRNKPFFFLIDFMNSKKIFDILGTVLLAIGFFFAFLPPAVHVSSGLEETHLEHVITGMVLVIIGLVILIYNNKALKIWK